MAPDYPARIGSYHVLGVIGTGKLGTVYRAYDEAQARVVALRVLSHELLNDAPRLERFRREAQALAALSHPNIVSTLDNGKDGELTYLVMEYVDGSSLVDRVRSARPDAERVRADRSRGRLRPVRGARQGHRPRRSGAAKHPGVARSLGREDRRLRH